MQVRHDLRLWGGGGEGGREGEREGGGRGEGGGECICMYLCVCGHVIGMDHVTLMVHYHSTCT